MIRKIAIAALLLIVIPFYNSFSMESPFNFLRYVSSARASALSGAFISVENDPNGLFYNPATIRTVESGTISATFLKHVLDINSGNITYIRDIEDIGKFAAAVAYTNYGEFDETNRMGDVIGSFGSNDLVMGITYSNELDSNFYYGVTLKYIYSHIHTASASALAVDAGLFYLMPDKRTNLGLSVLHSGVQLTKFNNVSEPLPVDIRAGLNHRLRGLPLLLNVSLHHLGDDTDEFFDRFKHFSIGGEFYFGEYVQFRLGYDNQVRNFIANKTDKGLSGFSAGLGIVGGEWFFNYGASIYSSAAVMHRFSIDFRI
jgi:hypothetical protein